MTSTRLFTCLACALMVSCTSEMKDITILTSPADATIFINGQEQVGKSPLIATVEQRKDVNIVAMRPGYKTANKTLTPETSTAYAILWTMYDERARYIEEDSVQLNLVKLHSSANYTPSALPDYNPPAQSGTTRTAAPTASSRPAPKSTFEAPELRPVPADLQH